jgi:hypothetical protein
MNNKILISPQSFKAHSTHDQSSASVIYRFLPWEVVDRGQCLLCIGSLVGAVSSVALRCSAKPLYIPRCLVVSSIRFVRPARSSEGLFSGRQRARRGAAIAAAFRGR